MHINENAAGNHSEEKTMRTDLDRNAPEETFLSLADVDAFDSFWRENGEFLDMDRQTAFDLACNCNLIVGGGAAPLFRVGFID